MPYTCQAYVARGPNESPDKLMNLEKVQLSDLQDNDVLVEVIAVGICHSDVKASQGKFLMPPPLLPGHEGSGYVKEVGSRVTYVKPGDAVVLSYASCMDCRYCLSGRNPYCDHLAPLNFSGKRFNGSAPATLDEGGPVNGLFFGQSSMGKLAVAHENSCVKVDATKEELKMFAPLGCGIQTGFGSVVNVCKPPPQSAFLVFGAGAVGISALLAASLYSPTALILVDVSERKLEHPATAIATHKICSPLGDPVDIPKRVAEITKGRGADFAVDAVGSGDVLKDGHAALSKQGMLLTIGGVLAQPKFDIGQHVVKGITYRGTHQGDSVSRLMVPYLIDLWRQSKFPLNGLLKFYAFEDVDTALNAIKEGTVIKPILVV